MANRKGMAGKLFRNLKITRQGDEVTLVRDHRSGCTALFLGVWLTGWTAGCVAMTWAIFYGKGDIPWLFPIPFYVGEIVAIVIFVSALTHREFIRLDRDGLKYWRSAVFQLGHHQIPLDELESFTITIQNFDSGGKLIDASATPEKRAWGLATMQAEGVGMPFPFFGTVAAEDAQEAIGELDSVLAILRPNASLTPASSTIRPPAGSAWRQVNDEDCVRLDRTSRSSCSAILVSLGIALFWNSIVGIFTGMQWGWFPTKGAPKGGEWWFLFFFLMPFQLIGAILLFVLASTIWEWLVRESWRLYRNRLVQRKSLFGIGVGTTTYENIDCLRLDCLPESNDEETAQSKAEESEPGAKPDPPAIGGDELPPINPQEDTSKPPMTFFPDGQPIEVDSEEEPNLETWKLVFVKRDETPLLEWKGLSFGEARWLGSVVLRERPAWFHERG